MVLEWVVEEEKSCAGLEEAFYRTNLSIRELVGLSGREGNLEGMWKERLFMRQK